MAYTRQRTSKKLRFYIMWGQSCHWFKCKCKPVFKCKCKPVFKYYSDLDLNCVTRLYFVTEMVSIIVYCHPLVAGTSKTSPIFHAAINNNQFKSSIAKLIDKPERNGECSKCIPRFPLVPKYFGSSCMRNSVDVHNKVDLILLSAFEKQLERKSDNVSF